MYFTIMDFRRNYVKFADPLFNGDPVSIKEVGEHDPFPNDEKPDGQEEGGGTGFEDDGFDDGELWRGGAEYRGG